MTFVRYWIDAARAKETIEAGQAIVLDVTSPFIESAVRGKIPGAVRVSPRGRGSMRARCVPQAPIRAGNDLAAQATRLVCP